MIALGRRLGGWLGWIAGSALRIRRAHVEGAMRVAGVAEPSRAARAMYRALGTSLVEFLAMAAGPARVGDARALRGAPPGSATLAEAVVALGALDPASRGPWADAHAQARRAGTGMVLAASHTGNWDLAACAIAREVELWVITKHLSVGWLDRVWQSTRARFGVRLTDAGGALGVGKAALRRGAAVAMMIDQVPDGRRGIDVEFLGATACADRAPAALAASTGAPLVVTASHREASGRHVLHVLDVLWPPAREAHGARTWVDEATRRATASLDAFVRAHPDQWLWLHRRWRRPHARET